eukprot:3356485-Pyramimonas_sp.AAC.1
MVNAKTNPSRSRRGRTLGRASQIPAVSGEPLGGLGVPGVNSPLMLVISGAVAVRDARAGEDAAAAAAREEAQAAQGDGE